PMISDILSVEEEDNNAATTEQEITITWHRRAIQAIASVAAIVIFMLFIATPVDNFQPVNDYAGLVSTEILTQQEVATNSDVSITQEEVVAAIESATIEEKTIVCDHTAETLNSANTADETPLQVNIDTNTTPRYILVIGSLPTQELAQKQIAEFAEKGVSEHINIYEHNGRHRLYIDGYDTLSQAQERLDEINAQANSVFAGIWICSTL
ncbi:MAG: SPOR domain-containing protein, partial [Bacteroidaceae bacterium]|nr:SPOR domain-containing protein [Bacteroidaceae bacterium]